MMRLKYRKITQSIKLTCIRKSADSSRMINSEKDFNKIGCLIPKKSFLQMQYFAKQYFL